MLGGGQPFEELKQALQEIESEGVFEEISDDAECWSDALRAAVAGQEGFGSLTDEEIDAIADSTVGISLDAARIKRLGEAIRERRKNTPLAHWSKVFGRGNLVPAAVFRRDGPQNHEEQRKAQETLERLRRELDEEDHPSR